jgi:anthranilate phosphoribosyltransferase
MRVFAELMNPILERKDLEPDGARALMHYLLSGDASSAQIGGALLALRVKGCTTKELAAFASVLREKALQVEHDFDDLVDTCGTGGGSPSFNISTASAIVASAAGAKIAKHGNRAVTSKCGMADVLEALGIQLGGDPLDLRRKIETHGIAFLFAPAHHSALRIVGAARKELGIRTVFNQLGPLANPAGARRQLIGVYEAGLMRSMGEALKALNAERALLVHGQDGLDEISPVAPTDYVKLWDGRVSTGTFELRDFGLEPIDPEALLPGETADENAVILTEAVSNPDSLRSQAILPNVAAALWLAGVVDDPKSGVEVAREAIADGRALQKLRDLQAQDASA